MAVEYLLAQSGGMPPVVGKQEEIGTHIPELSDSEEEEEETDVTVCLVTDVDEALLSARSFQSTTTVGKSLALPLKKRPLSQTEDGAQPSSYYTMCDTCGLMLPTGELAGHMVSHFNEPLQRCVICSRDCSSEEDLEKHMRSHAVTLVQASSAGSKTHFFV